MLLCYIFPTLTVVTITLNGSKTLNLLQISEGEGQELAGKDYVFQIRVTPYSFTPNHRTFTVSAISDASSFCTHAHAEVRYTRVFQKKILLTDF